MNTTTIGRRAEDAAAAYLRRKGYEIVQQNWRTRWCEIDIIALKDGAVSFVEVKYRRRNGWGSGLDYITPTKLRQMHFAAEFWIAKQRWRRGVQLSTVEVTGPGFEVTEFIPEL